MAKSNSFPNETRDPATLAKRIKKDLTTVVFSVVIALAAAAGTYMLITK